MNLAVVPAAPGLPARGTRATAEPPLLTYYDDATGERAELTATELGRADRGAAPRWLRPGCG